MGIKGFLNWFQERTGEEKISTEKKKGISWQTFVTVKNREIG